MVILSLIIVDYGMRKVDDYGMHRVADLGNLRFENMFVSYMIIDGGLYEQ